jgi:hypothetical protein
VPEEDDTTPTQAAVAPGAHANREGETRSGAGNRGPGSSGNRGPGSSGNRGPGSSGNRGPGSSGVAAATHAAAARLSDAKVSDGTGADSLSGSIGEWGGLLLSAMWANDTGAHSDPGQSDTRAHSDPGQSDTAGTACEVGQSGHATDHLTATTSHAATASHDVSAPAAPVSAHSLLSAGGFSELGGLLLEMEVGAAQDMLTRTLLGPGAGVTAVSAAASEEDRAAAGALATGAALIGRSLAPLRAAASVLSAPRAEDALSAAGTSSARALLSPREVLRLLRLRRDIRQTSLRRAVEAPPWLREHLQ